MTENAPVAIVTGGSAGIGWAIGQRLVADGYRVIATDLVPGLTESSEDVLWRELDVTDHAQVGIVFGQIVSEFGRIDALINNAGIQRHRALEDLTAQEWQSVVDVNLNGVFNTLQAGGRHMLERGEGR